MANPIRAVLDALQGRSGSVIIMADLSTLDRARAAKARAHKVFSELADVVGAGITTIGSEYGLKVNVSSPPPSSKMRPSARC